MLTIWYNYRRTMHAYKWPLQFPFIGLECPKFNRKDPIRAKSHMHMTNSSYFLYREHFLFRASNRKWICATLLLNHTTKVVHPSNHGVLVLQCKLKMMLSLGTCLYPPMFNNKLLFLSFPEQKITTFSSICAFFLFKGEAPTKRRWCVCCICYSFHKV